MVRVFVTGATGFVGSAIVPELLAHGHSVVALARSDKSEEALKGLGVDVVRGSLADVAVLREAAAAADGVIHTAFDVAPLFSGDLARLAANGEEERLAVEAIGEALVGTNKPFVITSGVLVLPVGQLSSEETPGDKTGSAAGRVLLEEYAVALAKRGVRTSVIRLSVVHDGRNTSLLKGLIATAKAKGASGYVGDGSQRWSAIHNADSARLYRLALEKAPAGSILHGISEETVPIRDVAEEIGRQLKIPAVSVAPEAAPAHFGFLGIFLGRDGPGSSAITRKLLGWQPEHPGLIADLVSGDYFKE